MATSSGRALPGNVRRVVLILSVGVLTLSCVLTGFVLQQTARPAHAAAVEEVLLLIHGYTDNCATAFDTTDSMGGTPNNTTTTQFLRNQGWGHDYDPIVEVGYYNNLPSGFTQDTGSCTEYNGTGTANYDDFLQDYDDNGGCDQYWQNRQTDNPPASVGGANDPIQHLGCLLAHYISDNFTSHGITVYVLAHSMGGLIIRDAIGQIGQSGFPSSLNVARVVTVATPHGGVCCAYNQLAQHFTAAGETAELEDMLPGSSHSNFMSLISGMQSPQSSSGTQWYLMAASDDDGCPGGTGSQAVSCFAVNLSINNPNPDGDGIVQASSALAMSGATAKILYGVTVNEISPGIVTNVYTADTQTEYAHETNTCGTIPGGSSVCLGSPNYLNDGTTGEGTTKAWTCSAPNCTNSALNFDDMGITGTAGSAPRSLQQISDWLPKPASPTPTPVPPTSTPTVAPGACVRSPGDANCDNQDYQAQGCNAYGQSQIYNVSPLYVRLYYSTNCQSNWTSASVSSGYVLHQVWIERQETLAEAALNLSNTVSSATWYTNMVWAPNSPARSCATYKNLSTGTISGTYCTAWSPVSTTCKSSLSDAHCSQQDYVVQGCNAYAQSSPAPNSNSIVSVTDYYSTNCESNWAVVKLVTSDPDWFLISAQINRGPGSLGTTSASASDSRGDSTWWSPMVFAPSNQSQACVTYGYYDGIKYRVYTLCTGMA